MSSDVVISYIKQSIEILLMMKEDDCSDEIAKERKKAQKLTNLLDTKKKTKKPVEENFVEKIKNKIFEDRRFRFDKEYLDISTFDGYTEVSTLKIIYEFKLIYRLA